MSTELGIIENTGVKGGDLQFTHFWGGGDKGRMIQLTQGLGTLLGNDEPGYIHLTVEDASRVIKILKKWIKSGASMDKIEEE